MNRRLAWLSLFPLLGWWLTGLFDLDEGFYGAITAEMNRRHEWITPYYNGHPWFEKPILLYWIAKPCLWLFGDAVGPRLPSVLAAAGIYGLLYWFARRRLSPGTEVWAPLIAGSSLLMVGAGRMMLTDPLLVLCLTAAVLTFIEARLDTPKWWLVTGFALGAGVLAKGPVSLILFGIPYLLAFRFLRRDKPGVTYPLLGLVVLAAVIASWYVPCYLQNREVFIQKFLIEQNLNRFTGGDDAHTLGLASLPLYIPLLIIGFAPWSFFPRLTWSYRKDESGVRMILWAWAIGTFVFFSLSGAKLPHYILPCFPPLALLVADALAQSKRVKISLALGMIGAMTAIANGVLFLYYQQSGQAEAHAFIRTARDGGGSVAMYQLGRREKDKGTGTLKVRETSLPSLYLYLNANATDTDDLATLRAANTRWVFTRKNRLSDTEIAELGGVVRREGVGYRLIERVNK